MMRQLLLVASMILLASAAPTHAKKAHFTVEFIPAWARKGAGKRCDNIEVFVLQSVLADLIQKDTGFGDPASQQYLPVTFNKGKHPGFDFTYECPATCDDFTNSKEWCDVLCQGEHYETGNDRLEKLGLNLKDQMHEYSKGIRGPFRVKCLGIGEKLDLHLRVAVSPFIPAPVEDF
jgi:hypothetical protein